MALRYQVKFLVVMVVDQVALITVEAEVLVASELVNKHYLQILRIPLLSVLEGLHNQAV